MSSAVLFPRNITLNEPACLSRKPSILRRAKGATCRTKRRLFGANFHRHHRANFNAGALSLCFAESNLNDKTPMDSTTGSVITEELQNEVSPESQRSLKRKRSNVHDWFHSLQGSPKRRLRKHHFKWFTSSNNVEKTEEILQKNQESTDALPAEAVSCYKQFKVQKFDDVFSGESLTATHDTEQSVAVPQYSPVDALDYESLQMLNQKIFNLSTFSFFASEVFDDPNDAHDSSAEATAFGIKATSLEVAPELSAPEIANGLSTNGEPEYLCLSAQDHESIQRMSQMMFTIPQFSFTGGEALNYPFHGEDSWAETTGSESDAGSLERAPELLAPDVDDRKFMSVKQQQQQHLFTTDDGQAEKLFLDSTKKMWWEENNDEFEQACLESIGSVNSALEEVSGETSLTVVAAPSEATQTNVTKNMFLKAKSVIWGGHKTATEQLFDSASRFDEGCDDTSARPRSSESNYSPVTILVPTLRHESFIAELTDSIIDGCAIDQIYHPEDQTVDDENTPFRIKDSSFFNHGTLPLETPISTIRFDEFSQVLFYNGSSKLQASGERASAELQSLRMEAYKESGSLSLESPCSGMAKLKMDAVVSRSVGTVNSEPRSILKSKLNKNINDESLRVDSSDKLDIWDFMQEFNLREKERMDAIHDLDSVREKQLDFYYQEVVQDRERVVSLLDSSDA